MGDLRIFVGEAREGEEKERGERELGERYVRGDRGKAKEVDDR